MQLVLCKMHNLEYQQQEELSQFCATWKKTGGPFDFCRCNSVSLFLPFITEALLWKL